MATFRKRITVASSGIWATTAIDGPGLLKCGRSLLPLQRLLEFVIRVSQQLLTFLTWAARCQVCREDCVSRCAFYKPPTTSIKHRSSHQFKSVPALVGLDFPQLFSQLARALPEHPPEVAHEMAGIMQADGKPDLLHRHESGKQFLGLIQAPRFQRLRRRAAKVLVKQVE